MDAAVRERRVQWEWLKDSAENPLHREAHILANGLATQSAKPQPAAAPGPPEKLTHTDEAGRPRMVDIAAKPDTVREAVARGAVRMKASTFDLIKGGSLPKGDVLTVAQLAGIMAAKQTSSLIPLCHPLLIGDVNVEFILDEEEKAVQITATVKSTGKTGVEMEALTATAVAALTIYDMCKGVDRGMKIENIRLARKSGGKSGTIVLE
ncbi:MAG: cyclic pyranopterin monophosphate synthase MoaC [Chloroflexi bacterium]|nr:cyclic pyranopterin monophosphate synthase MoaC [Chloroflexota bacterium]